MIQATRNRSVLFVNFSETHGGQSWNCKSHDALRPREDSLLRQTPFIVKIHQESYQDIISVPARQSGGVSEKHCDAPTLWTQK